MSEIEKMMLEVLKELNSGKNVERLNLEDVTKRFREKTQSRDYTLEYVEHVLVHKLYFIIEESRNVVVFTQEGLRSVLRHYGML